MSIYFQSQNSKKKFNAYQDVLLGYHWVFSYTGGMEHYLSVDWLSHKTRENCKQEQI